LAKGQIHDILVSAVGVDGFIGIFGNVDFVFVCVMICITIIVTKVFKLIHRIRFYIDLWTIIEIRLVGNEAVSLETLAEQLVETLFYSDFLRLNNTRLDVHPLQQRLESLVFDVFLEILSLFVQVQHLNFVELHFHSVCDGIET